MLSTIPVILDDLENLLYILDVDQRYQLVSQLIALDNGVLNFGEWVRATGVETFVGLVQLCHRRSDGARLRHGPEDGQ